MDIAQVQALVGRLTDQQLAQEANKPSGIAPVYMIMAELQRRAGMRKSSPQPVQGYARGGPVYDEDYYDYFRDLLPGVTVNSGYRDEEHNREVGGVENSYHTRRGAGRGQAMDLHVPRGQEQEYLRRVRAGPRPLSEALFHRNHLHVAWGGPQRYGAGSGRRSSGANGSGGAPAAQPAAPAAAPSTPAAPGFDMGSYLAAMGFPGGKVDPRAIRAEAEAALRDRTTAAYEALAAQIQRQQQQFESSNRGRPLMEMGLAMMNARGPNFFNALGQGGMAGLGARDRIQSGRQELMSQLLQSQMGQAQAQSERDRSIMEAYTGQLGGARNAVGTGMGLGLQARGQDQQAQQAAVQAGLEERRIAAMQGQNAQQQANFERSAGQQDRALDQAEARSPILRPGMPRERYAQWITNRSGEILEMMIKGNPTLTMDPAALKQAQDQALFQASAELRRNMGLAPKVVNAAGNPVNVAAPGNTGSAGTTGTSGGVVVRDPSGNGSWTPNAPVGM